MHHDFPKRSADDDAFTMAALPVTREHLHREWVSETFVEYLDAGWPDFVAG